MNVVSLAFRYMAFIFVIIGMSVSSVPMAYAQETDQDAPVSAVGGAVHADPFTGTATTSIPIEVPPGRGGIQPDLALVYGSSNGNGWLGMGWKLEKGVIERQTKFGVDYSGDDYVFRLSGINVELVNIGNDEYRAKVEGGFTRIKKLTATDGRPYFEATDTTGKTFIFGSEVGTRAADPANADKIFRWCLERVEDVHGNYMTLSYTSDQGQTYLTQIDYTANDNGGLLPTNQVKFSLESLPAAPKMYVPNFEMTTAKRLKTIEVKANGNLVRVYKLTYTNSLGISHSLLASVQQFGNNAILDTGGGIIGGSGTPPVQIIYGGQDSFGDLQSFSAFEPPFHIAADGHGDLGARFVDLNGDGRMDFVWHRLLANGTTQKGAYLSTGAGWESAPSFETNYPLVEDAVGDVGARFVDLNGDGRMDFVWHRLLANGTTQKGAYLSTGTGWESAPSFETNYPLVEDAVGDVGARFVDLNGDGRMDFVWHRLLSDGTTRQGAVLSTGTGWIWGPYFNPPFHIAADGHGDLGARFVDLNGDGRMDFVWHRLLANGTTQKGAVLNTGTSWESAPAFEPPFHIAADGQGDLGARFVDLNGDGRMDFVWHRLLANGTTQKGAYLSTGTGWESAPSFETNYPLVEDAVGDVGARFVDLNGDGRMDFVWHRLLPDSTTTQGAVLSMGTGWIWGPYFNFGFLGGTLRMSMIDIEL